MCSQPRGRGISTVRHRRSGHSEPSIDRSLDIDRVPEHDGCCDQGEAAGAIALLLETAVPYFSEPAEEDCSGQGIARFAFIEADLNPTAQLDALSQDRMNKVRSMRPSSRKATARPFCRG